MRFSVLGSGSAGNATLVAHGEHALLVDCGLTVRQIERRLGLINWPPTSLSAIVLTHEHDDHIVDARQSATARRAGPQRPRIARVAASVLTPDAARSRTVAADRSRSRSRLCRFHTSSSPASRTGATESPSAGRRELAWC